MKRGGGKALPGAERKWSAVERDIQLGEKTDWSERG